jgi:Flp pilus assembly pilin Flp
MRDASRPFSARDLIARFVQDENGQDIIEYGLLAAFIGVVGILAWQSISGQISAHYTGWDTAIQTRSACTPDPGGGGC